MIFFPLSIFGEDNKVKISRSNLVLQLNKADTGQS